MSKTIAYSSVGESKLCVADVTSWTLKRWRNRWCALNRKHTWRIPTLIRPESMHLATTYFSIYAPRPFGIHSMGKLRNLSTYKIVLLYQQKPQLAVHLLVGVPYGLVKVEQRGVANHSQPSSRVL